MNNKTNVSIGRADINYHTVDGDLHVYPSVMVKLSRNTGKKIVKINRRFHGTTFGTLSNAWNEARAFANWASELPNKRFEQCKRPRGRSRHSHYFVNESIQS